MASLALDSTSANGLDPLTSFWKEEGVVRFEEGVVRFEEGLVAVVGQTDA